MVPNRAGDLLLELAGMQAGLEQHFAEPGSVWAASISGGVARGNRCTFAAVGLRLTTPATNAGPLPLSRDGVEPSPALHRPADALQQAVHYLYVGAGRFCSML